MRMTLLYKAAQISTRRHACPGTGVMGKKVCRQYWQGLSCRP